MAVGAAVAWWQAHADAMLRELCKDSFDLDVEIKIPDARKDSAPAALKAMEKVMLPFLLKGAGGRRGLFVLDGALIDALIEIQMLDKVLPTPRLDRPITAIDAGLSEGFVHKCLAAMADAPGMMSDLSVVDAEQDRSALRLALRDGQFDIMAVEIDMGPGIKTGLFELWLPVSAPAKPPASKPNPKMTSLLSECEVELDTSMIGCKVSAAELMALAPGALIRLPVKSLTDVTVSDCDARRIATGRLGQLNGMRAVLITEIKGGAGPAQKTSDAGQTNLPAPTGGALEPIAPKAATEGDKAEAPAPSVAANPDPATAL